MPIRYAIDVPLHMVYTELTGNVTDADLREHLTAMRGDARFDAMMSELIDMQGVTTMSISSRMMEESARINIHAPTARRAFVAPTDLLFGLSRKYQLHLQVAEQVEVYRELQPALEFLGLLHPSQLPSLPPLEAESEPR